MMNPDVGYRCLHTLWLLNAKVISDSVGKGWVLLWMGLGCSLWKVTPEMRETPCCKIFPLSRYPGTWNCLFWPLFFFFLLLETRRACKQSWERRHQVTFIVKHHWDLPSEQKISRPWQQVEAQRWKKDRKGQESLNDIIVQRPKILMTSWAFYVVLPRLILQTCHHWHYHFIEGWQPDKAMGHKRLNGRQHSSNAGIFCWYTKRRSWDFTAQSSDLRVTVTNSSCSTWLCSHLL